MIFWVAAFLKANADPGNAGSLLRVDAAYWLAQFQYLQDAHDAWLDEGAAQAMATASQVFAVLSKACWRFQAWQPPALPHHPQVPLSPSLVFEAAGGVAESALRPFVYGRGLHEGDWPHC